MDLFKELSTATKPSLNPEIWNFRNELSKLHDKIAMLDVDEDEQDQLDRICDSLSDALYNLNRLDKQR